MANENTEEADKKIEDKKEEPTKGKKNKKDD